MKCFSTFNSKQQIFAHSRNVERNPKLCKDQSVFVFWQRTDKVNVCLLLDDVFIALRTIHSSLWSCKRNYYRQLDDLQMGKWSQNECLAFMFLDHFYFSPFDQMRLEFRIEEKTRKKQKYEMNAEHIRHVFLSAHNGTGIIGAIKVHFFSSSSVSSLMNCVSSFNGME